MMKKRIIFLLMLLITLTSCKANQLTPSDEYKDDPQVIDFINISYDEHLETLTINSTFKNQTGEKIKIYLNRELIVLGNMETEDTYSSFTYPITFTSKQNLVTVVITTNLSLVFYKDETFYIESEEPIIPIEPVDENNLYVSSNASSNGNGTIENPYRLEEAILKIVPGGTINVLPGIYLFDKTIVIPFGNNGIKDKMKKINGIGDVKFDFSLQAYGNPSKVSNPRGLALEASFWHISNITFYGAADNGMYISGNDNIIDNCVFEANRDSGLQLGRRNSSLTKIVDWPSRNLIINCTSFNNYDPDNGEDADGFACKLTTGYDNVFDGCISYHNTDDGYDLFTKSETGPIGPVTLINCLAFNNGVTKDGLYTKDSDGNGFKLGGSNISVEHQVINCASFNNRSHGFTDNSNPGRITLRNLTSFGNGQAKSSSNFDFARQDNSNNLFSHLLSFGNASLTSDKFRGEAEYSVFYNTKQYYLFTILAPCDQKISSMRGEKINVTNQDFYSTSFMKIVNPHKDLRNEHNEVDLKDFLKIRETSPLYKAGLNGNFIGAIFD